VEIGEGEKRGCGEKRGLYERRLTGEPRSGKGEIAKSGKYLMMRHFWGQKVLLHSRFVVQFAARGRNFPDPFCQKGCFLAAVVLKPVWAASGVFEDQGAAIAERDFGWSPSGALVILPGIIPYRLPFLIESGMLPPHLGGE